LKSDNAKDRLATIEKQIYKMIVSSKKVNVMIDGRLKMRNSIRVMKWIKRKKSWVKRKK